MKLKAIALLFGITISIGGCKSLEAPVGAPGLEGFVAFATPRDFDGPGTIYRIDPESKRFKVTKLETKPATGGEERIPKFTSTRDLSLSQLLEAIGAKAELLPATVNSELSSKRNTVIEATTGNRLQLSDEDVSAALQNWVSKNKPVAGSKYYLIRETIATQTLSYKISKDWLATIGLDLRVLNVAGYKGGLKAASGDALELDTKFDKALNVWYKAEQVSFEPALGAGPNQYKIKLIPLSAGQTLGL